jgi:hypothetical protein
MKKKFLSGMAALLCASLFFLGCPTDGDDDPVPPPAPNKATNYGLVFTAPATGETPDAAIGAATEYTGTIAWSPEIAEGGTFAAGESYTATVTLAAKDGYTFNGVEENVFTYDGTADTLPSVTNPAGTGTTIVVTVVFEATLDPDNPTVVNAVTLTDLFDAPVTGETPDAAIGTATQYTGTIVWNPAIAEGGTFAAGTSYTATVTLEPKPGYTFAGIAEQAAGNSTFIYAGAQSVANTVGTATGITVTIVFGATGDPDDPTVVSALALGGFFYAPVTGEEPDGSFTGSQYTGTIVWNPAIAGDGKFVAEQVYTATVALTVINSGFTFTGVTGNFTHGTITGASSNNTGTGITVTIVFPKTDEVGGQEPEPESVTALDLKNAIVAPSIGVAPNAAFTTPNAQQYTGGTVTWAGELDSGKFKAGESYTATVTLTAEEDYTFDDVGSFTYNSLTVTASNNTGTAVTVTVTFTALSATDGNLKVTVDFNYEGITVEGTPNQAKTEIVITVTDEGYNGIEWYFDDGEKVDTATYTLTLNTLGTKRHHLTVFALKNGVPYSETQSFTAAELAEMMEEEEEPGV